MAEALYRKYRPQIFEDVVGQEHIERTIKNAIDQDKVSHAYLFTGPRGTGKTTTARLLAKALLCEKGPTAEPDGTCADCETIANGTHPDVYELDAASRTGVENVREEIIGRVQFAPTQGRCKVYIIDEVHMLSTAAFNALLKTLEEPPSHVVFILCTTDPQKVPETIHSRCQRFDFRRISAEAIVSRLGAICVAEEVEFEGEALDLIAHRAEGGMRNALTSLEQLIAFGEGRVTLEDAERLLGSLDSNDMAEIVSAIGKRDIATCFEWTAGYIETGADLAQFVRDLSEHIRNMYVLSLSDSDTVLEINEVIRRELAEELQYFGQDRLTRMLSVLGDLSAELRTSTNPRLSFEIALTRMVRPDSDVTLEALAERIEALESGYSATASVFSSPMPATQQADASPVSVPAAASVRTDQAAASTRPTAASTLADSAGSSRSSQGQAVQVDQGQVAQADRIPSTPEPTSTDARQGAVPAPQGVYEAASAQQDAAASPEPSAQPQQSVLAGLGNPAALQRIWQATLQAVKRDKAAYGVLFLNTKVHYDDVKQELVVEFPAENVFAFSAVQKPEVLAVVSGALAQAAGGTVAFRYTQVSDAGQNAAATRSQQVATPLQADRTDAQQSQPFQVQASPPPASAQMQAVPVTSAAQSSENQPSVSQFMPAGQEPTQNAGQMSTGQAAIPNVDQASTGQAAVPNVDQASTGQASATGQPSTQKPVSLTPENAADSFDEDALKSMLTQEYGEGIVFDIIEEE